jgi:Creatinase/Prolidase N-terminal domain
MQHQQRIQRLLQRMRLERIDLLVAASHARHSLDIPDHATHLSQFRSLGESLFLLFANGETLLIASPSSDGERIRARATGSCVATDDLPGTLAALMAERTGPATRVATAGIDVLPYGLADELSAVLNRPTIDFERAIESSRSSVRAQPLSLPSAAMSTCCSGRGRACRSANWPLTSICS